MSTLDTKKHFLKTVLTYTFFIILCLVINKVYSLFSHGVSSSYMTYMFLYPFIGCIIIFIPFWILAPQIRAMKGYRAFYNLYNTGIAALTLGSCLKGIVSIAGTDTPYSYLFFYLGACFIFSSIIVLIISLIKYRGN